MIICGHTMGTPEYDVFQAAELFAKIGYEAIEIICTHDYSCAVNTDWPEEKLDQLRRHLDQLHLGVICLTPYLHKINAADPILRNACLQEAEKVIIMASRLQAKGVRILAGTGVKGDRTQATEILVQSLRRLSEFSRSYGVELWLENHSGSLADSALATAEIVRQVGQTNVGIVYDQTNLTELRAEESEEALRLQFPYIRHVHVKAKKWSDNGSTATLLGEGNVNWEAIIYQLGDMGFDGSLCYEYERRWAPDVLPPAETGMAHGYKYLSRVIQTK